MRDKFVFESGICGHFDIPFWRVRRFRTASNRTTAEITEHPIRHSTLPLKSSTIHPVMLRLRCVYLLLLAGPAFAGDQGFDTSGAPRLTVANEPPAPREFARSDALISTDALARLIASKDPKLVLIDARNEQDYGVGHLPGARNLSSDSLQDPEAAPYYMPSAESLKTLCAELGIQADSRVVIYDEDDGRLSARIWFVLHSRGHEHVTLLDGGIGKWHDERRAMSFDPPMRSTPGTFEPAVTLRGACVFDELPQFRTRGRELGKMPAVSLLDARSPGEYSGEEVRGKVGGHIPGAANIEWSNLMSGHEHIRVWRSPPEIHAILRMAGVEREAKVALYDQAGARSAHLYFTLWLMGHEHAFNYVGGWREYAKKDGIEIEK
jgi:thiosulfate/3-mercaptopyruvate sulfurtransferase